MILKFWILFFVFWQITLWAISQDTWGGLDFFDPLKISFEMAYKVIRPQKNYIPHFQNQRYINSYNENKGKLSPGL